MLQDLCRLYFAVGFEQLSTGRGDLVDLRRVEWSFTSCTLHGYGRIAVVVGGNRVWGVQGGEYNVVSGTANFETINQGGQFEA